MFISTDAFATERNSLVVAPENSGTVARWSRYFSRAMAAELRGPAVGTPGTAHACDLVRTDRPMHKRVIRSPPGYPTCSRCSGTSSRRATSRSADVPERRGITRRTHGFEYGCSDPARESHPVALAGRWRHRCLQRGVRPIRHVVAVRVVPSGHRPLAHPGH